MKARLREQAIKGYRGWDDPDNYQRIVDMMVEHAAADEGKEVGAANLAMILYGSRSGGDAYSIVACVAPAIRAQIAGASRSVVPKKKRPCLCRGKWGGNTATFGLSPRA